MAAFCGSKNDVGGGGSGWQEVDARKQVGEGREDFLKGCW